MNSKIDSGKVLVRDAFNMWFKVPEYQRPYVWGSDHVNDLLEDISFACSDDPEKEYFLGSIVFHAKCVKMQDGGEYTENDLLDGQQRLTTIYLLMAVARDLSDDEELKQTCEHYIYQTANQYTNTPERFRIVFEIRDSVKAFIHKYIRDEGSTNTRGELENKSRYDTDVTVRNMARAILQMRNYFERNEGVSIKTFFGFLLNKVLLVYVSTEDLDDAFRLFTILNDRGVPLRNSDILKAWNLGVLESEEEKRVFGRFWEDTEGELGEDFDRFLSYIRTILVKEKARQSLLKEFELKIYKSKDKFPLLNKGKETFEYISLYKNHYSQIFGGNNHSLNNSFEFDNIIVIMNLALPSTDWVPPLLAYYNKFKDSRLLDFLKMLDNKFSADWILRETSTTRFENMNSIIKTIEESSAVDTVFSSGKLSYDLNSLADVFSKPLYGERYAKYLLLKLNNVLSDRSIKSSEFRHISIEHILPQTPSNDSQWCVDFTDKEREDWTDKLGNLILLSRRKNASLGRLDYINKKEKYFENNINTFSVSLRALSSSEWKPHNIKDNHINSVKELSQCYS